MATAGGERVSALFDRASSADSLAEVIFTGLGAILLSVGGAISSGVLTVADVVTIPISAVTEGAGGLIGSLFGAAENIIDLGGLATALSLGPNGMFNVGPFTFGLAVGSLLLGFWVLRAYIALETTSNVFPGLPFDIPTPGFTDAEEEKEE